MSARSELDQTGIVMDVSTAAMLHAAITDHLRSDRD